MFKNLQYPSCCNLLPRVKLQPCQGRTGEGNPLLRPQHPEGDLDRHIARLRVPLAVVPVRVTGSRNKKKGALCTGHTQLGRFGDSSYRLITRQILWVSERDAMLVRTGGL